MKRLVSAVAVASGLVTPALFFADQPQPLTVFVSAVDRKGAAVPDLTAREFSITEDDIDRRVLDVRSATDRMTLAIVIDERGLWSGPIRQSVESLARALDGADIGLFSVVRPEFKVIDFTPASAVFIDRLRQVAPITTQEKFDFEWLPVVQDVARTFMKQRVARPVIVAIDQNAVLSGGLPPTWDLVLKDVQRSRTTVYAIGKGSVRRLLDAAAEASGGTAETVLTDNGFPAAADRVAQRMLAQYAVRYESAQPAAGGSRLRINVTRPGVTATAVERVYR
jgi:hypothetical protein